MHNTLSCYSFPTTVVLIDDNPRFLKRTQAELKNLGIAAITYDHAKDFLNFINHPDTSNSFLLKCIKWLEEDEYDHRTLDINIKRIHEIIHNNLRFKKVSVILVDYAMPDMNGLELLEQINDKSLKTILLTGEADERIAVEAFNKGLIDSYIRKEERNFESALVKTIKNLEHEYFYESSRLILDSMTKNLHRPSCLGSLKFIHFFYELCQKEKVVEYYLLDEFGSFLLLNAAGKPTWLAVVPNEEINHFYEMAEDYVEDVEPIPEKLLKVLKEKTKIPFFYSEKNLQIMPINWENYLFDTHIIDDQFYYAIIKNKKVSDIDFDKIKSYEEFLK